MILFASQRGSGQDLATHLMNEHDNEYMEVADLRGSVAGDLHGAFSEWEAQASAMTRCSNYLYSLSISPDQTQGRLTREQYADFIGRADERLGLAGQPRAVVFHIKPDKSGESREHCHVIWSRIDVQDMKAIHMAFDHDTLMMVAREFARDHGLILPGGYHKARGQERRKNRQLSLYEKNQQDTTGLTKEERMAVVTQCWRHSDNATSFVAALQSHGYVLATGKRDYVLVDMYGAVNALPKLIDDRQVRAKDIRAFLGREFPPETLPSVEDVKALAAQHQKEAELFRRSQGQADQLDQLALVQRRRSDTLETKIAARTAEAKHEAEVVVTGQRSQRAALTSRYVQRAREIRRQREAARPQGLAGFLAKASGLELIRSRLHRYQDFKRRNVYLETRGELREKHRGERHEQQRRHEMQMLDLERKRRALELTARRELQSLKTSFLKQHRVKAREGQAHLPRLDLNLNPPGRPGALFNAKSQYPSPLVRGLPRFAAPETRSKPVELKPDFEMAARTQKTDGGDGANNTPSARKQYKRRRPGRGKGRRG